MEATPFETIFVYIMNKEQRSMQDIIGENIHELTQSILDDYEKTRHIDKLDVFNQPDTKVIYELIHELTRVAYPGYVKDPHYRIYDIRNNHEAENCNEDAKQDFPNEPKNGWIFEEINVIPPAVFTVLTQGYPIGYDAVPIFIITFHILFKKRRVAL